MKRIALAASALLLLGACAAATTPVASNRTITGPEAEAIPPSFSQFNDIPFPEKTVMNLEDTLLLGSGEEWIGRLAFSAPYTGNGMFDFFKAEMPKFGWEEFAVVRARISALVYQRGDRIAIITLDGADRSGVDIELTVTPKTRTAAPAM